jgi:hypothetical protein
MLCSLFLLFLAAPAFGQRGDGKERQSKRANREALKAWGESLSEDDYKPEIWQSLWKQPQYVFDHYIEQLSNTYLTHGATVNFILVGACDGTNDKTIRERYVPWNHWRGTFVEPFEMNYNDLVSFMEKNKVMNRTHIIHGACTDTCESLHLHPITVSTLCCL